MFGETADSWIPEDHPACGYGCVLSQHDCTERHAGYAGGGRPRCPTEVMTNLLIYGYSLASLPPPGPRFVAGRYPHVQRREVADLFGRGRARAKRRREMRTKCLQSKHLDALLWVLMSFQT